jgi:hypothetical protein
MSESDDRGSLASTLAEARGVVETDTTTAPPRLADALALIQEHLVIFFNGLYGFVI